MDIRSRSLSMKIQQRYNPEHDLPSNNQPDVTWVDSALLEIIEAQDKYIEQLEKRIEKIEEVMF